MLIKKRNAAQLIFLILLMAFILLISNVLLYFMLLNRWESYARPDMETVLDSLSFQNGSYTLTDDLLTALQSEHMFAMIIGMDGDVLLDANLPDSLNRQYTLQDVARFVRYYLDDYPVRTQIIPEGLLVLGSEQNTIWKYTLECRISFIWEMLWWLPLLILVDLLLCIFIPLFIQKRWMRQQETERTEWIAGVSHDIRTPLTLILGYADTIQASTEDPEILRRSAAIQKQSLRIRSLVANLNLSSKLNFSTGVLQKETFCLAEKLRSILSDFLNRMPDDHYSFRLEINDALQDTRISASSELFERMLENLLVNAVSHNPDGCSIEIQLDYADLHKKKMHLCISDDGAGTTEEILKRLNSRKTAGSFQSRDHGIGLQLVRQIADYHRWKVAFYNREPHGFEAEIIMFHGAL